MPADRRHLAGWLAGRFAGGDDAAFAVEGCTGWRCVAEELARCGVDPVLAEPADTAADPQAAAAHVVPLSSHRRAWGEAQRPEKLIDTAGIKLTAVATDMLGCRAG